jgi:hypothetical protein
MCQSVVDSDRMPVGRDLALFNGHVSQAGGTARRLTRRSAPPGGARLWLRRAPVAPPLEPSANGSPAGLFRPWRPLAVPRVRWRLARALRSWPRIPPGQVVRGTLPRDQRSGFGLERFGASDHGP